MSMSMKHSDFKPCHICGKGMMQAGQRLFLRISVDCIGIDAKAVERAHGLEQMMGANAQLANFTGPDEDLATVIDGEHDILICMKCASEPLLPYFWLEIV
jgi:hypothetical protein